MLYAGGTLSPFDSTLIATPNKPKFPLTGPLFPFISKTTLFVSSSPQTKNAQLSFKTRHNGPSLLRVSAINKKKHRKGGGGGEVMEADDSGFDEDYDDDGDAADDDEDEGTFTSLERMKSWLKNKPRGFGEGKSYDTSIEDKLLQEIELSRTAQIANINKLMNEPSSKKDEEKNKAPEDIPSGIRVRLFNLPKKKNIHRDLKLAFEGVPGIINIIPAVSGNKKTRDLICKGFAFIDFESTEYATRFVQSFSRKSIAFGKVQKEIRCEMMDSSLSNSVDEHSAEDTDGDSKLTVTGFAEDSDAHFDEDDNSSVSVMDAASDGSRPDDELDLAEIEDVRESLETITVSELNGSGNTEKAKKSATDSSSSDQQKKMHAIEKKLIAKGEVKKARNLDIDFAELEDARKCMKFETVSELNGCDNTEKAKKSATDSSSSNQQKKIKAIEEKVNAKGEVKKAHNLDIGLAELEEVKESLEFVTLSELNGSDNNTKETKKSATESSSSNRQKKIRETERKLIAKGKLKKNLKLGITGSAKRLKIKEKAVLTEVFSKYSVNAASTSEEER